MKMKEKVETILGGFLKRNKDYSVNIYVRNGITNNHMALLLLPIERVIKAEESKFILEWDAAQFNNFSLLYNEILDCYKERDKYNSQMVHVIMKNGVKVEFECVGLRV